MTVAACAQATRASRASHVTPPAQRLAAIRRAQIWAPTDVAAMDLRDDVAKLLEGPQPSSQYYLAVVGAVDWLDHEPSLRGTG